MAQTPTLNGSADAMLTEAQIETVWQNKMEAEARACYFGELANRESTIKRGIVVFTFIGSSGAVVTLLSNAPHILPILLSVAIAVLSGYATATNQDGKIKTLGRLHVEWLRLEQDYGRLWSHVYEKDAEEALDRCQDRERDLSEVAATEIGHEDKRWNKWLDVIHKKYETTEHVRT
jgi:hypothetical protein